MDAKARCIILQNDNLESENTLDTPSVIAPFEKEIEIKNQTISLALKEYSFSVIKVKF